MFDKYLCRLSHEEMNLVFFFFWQSFGLFATNFGGPFWSKDRMQGFFFFSIIQHICHILNKIQTWIKHRIVYFKKERKQYNVHCIIYSKLLTIRFGSVYTWSFRSLILLRSKGCPTWNDESIHSWSRRLGQTDEQFVQLLHLEHPPEIRQSCAGVAELLFPSETKKSGTAPLPSKPRSDWSHLIFF